MILTIFMRFKYYVFKGLEFDIHIIKKTTKTLNHIKNDSRKISQYYSS